MLEENPTLAVKQFFKQATQKPRLAYTRGKGHNISSLKKQGVKSLKSKESFCSAMLKLSLPERETFTLKSFHLAQ